MQETISFINPFANTRIAWGGSRFPWHSGHVIGCIVSGAAALVGFVFYGKRSPVSYIVRKSDRLDRDLRPIRTTALPNDFAKEQELRGCIGSCNS